MKQFEVVNATVHSPAKIAKADGTVVEYVALEITGREADGTESKAMYAFAPDLMAKLAPSLSQALLHIEKLQPKSSSKH